jgi:hypothetical protein
MFHIGGAEIFRYSHAYEANLSLLYKKYITRNILVKTGGIKLKIRYDGRRLV